MNVEFYEKKVFFDNDLLNDQDKKEIIDFIIEKSETLPLNNPYTPTQLEMFADDELIGYLSNIAFLFAAGFFKEIGKKI